MRKFNLSGMRLFFISLIISLLSSLADGRPYYFRHFRNDNGLSNNTVMNCIQDRKGFIWFGTKEGLTRFDGFQFKIFLNSPSVSNCLLNNFITSLCEDQEGWIWIGTPEGICYYIPDSDCFGTIKSENPKIGELIYDVRPDNNNCIWIAASSGTFKYNKESKKLSFYPADEYFSPRSIELTNAGDIWLAAQDGKIYKYIARTDNFSSYKILTEKEISESVRLVDILDAGNYGLIISSDISGLRQFDPNTGFVTNLFNKDDLWKNILIRRTCLFNNEEIWIGSESGIYIYNLKTGSYVTTLQMVPTDPFSLSNNAIRSITKDKEGGVWIGTFYGGVNYLPQQNKSFEKFYPTGLPGALNGNVVREIRADTYGNIWIGTEDAGLIKLDHQTGSFASFTGGYHNVNIDSRNIQGLLVDNDDLWIATYDNGIYILNIPSEKITRHFELKDGKSGLKTNSFITFLKTTDGAIYAGSVIGLYQFIHETSSFKLLDNVTAGTFIHSLYEDNKRNIWIGTYGRGLFKYNRSSGICDKILSDKGDYKGLEREHVTSIYEDNSHKIWFTTEGNGFSYVDGGTGAVIRFVPGKDIDFAIYCAMLQDGFGNLWITSTRGLLRLDPASKKFKIYTKDDGLLDNNFSYNSAYQDENGKMYFGTVSGLVSFFPAGIKENTFNPPVYFTEFQVNGKEYIVNSTGSPDFKSVLVTNRISLKYNQSSLSIDFVSPTFTSPNLVKYKYKMEGSDPDWVLISGNRMVYYTNLSHGEYRFRVLSSTDGDTWSANEARLNIKISPPIWFSVPAYALYIIISSFIGYVLISFYFKRNALEHQRKIDIIESNKEKEILNAKIIFFTNITHEVRTPLTLIKGPLDRVLKSGIKNSKDTEDNLTIIKRNTDRLLSLTNQLLDFRKTEKEMYKLSFIKTDLYELLESTFNLFLPYSEEKMISVKLHSPVNNYYLAVDREAITKILSNLLSNALKFAESKVDLYLEPGTDYENTIRIRVNSDGKLIPKDFGERIFEPFYQLDFDKPGEKGTGLGLSLARSLAELHNGRLYLDTNVRQCNSFVMELTKYQEESISGISNETVELNPGEHHEFEIFGSLENSFHNILLVEDEIEMGKFIAKEISGDYNVILTHNGDEALKALKKYNIVLIVSDVIMPVINGYELCRQIKSNIEYSHIPVILLTATIHLNARIEGLDSGADAYIEKPFTTELLIAQILNLIKNRSLDRQNYINSPLSHFKSVAMNKTDEEFLKKLNSILMDNISENDLSVERIAEKIGISVSTLYRKVKALTDLNSIEYIRLVRLKKAAELLSEGNYRINEISYLVGFSSPSYFATSFQKQFGISPSQFIRKLK
jgi:signal transduction histidine kinase/ligand-binding sensor domain-containing protein/DNA-binding response OmpR family regulator